MTRKEYLVLQKIADDLHDHMPAIDGECEQFQRTMNRLYKFVSGRSKAIARTKSTPTLHGRKVAILSPGAERVFNLCGCGGIKFIRHTVCGTCTMKAAGRKFYPNETDIK